MAKASPIVRAFNAGVFSVLMEGRTDLDRYSVSLRQGKNVVAVQQGPALARSGTEFRQPIRDETTQAVLIPFEFNKEQAIMLEIGGSVVRFHDDTGLITYDGVSIQGLSISAGCLVVTCATLPNAGVGSSLSLSGLPDKYNLNGVVGVITSKKVSGANTSYTLTTKYAGDLAVGAGALVSQVYEITHPFTTTEMQSLRYAQLVDVIYIWCGGRLQTLSRRDVYDWSFTEVAIQDGPFMDEDNSKGTYFTPSSTGKAVSSANGTASGGTNPALAFDDDVTSWWNSGVSQGGTLTIAPNTAFAAVGYWVGGPSRSTSTSYTAKDYCPGSWTFEGYDGSSWVVLDRQTDYVLYTNRRSAYIEIPNTRTFSQYRIVVNDCYSNGTVDPCISALAIASGASTVINLTASSTNGINNGKGFLATDVGRQIRLEGTDGYWRWAVITSVASTTVVQVKLHGGPLANTDVLFHWRMGYWSDTTGWPTVGLFFNDRLWLSGSSGAPDLVAWTATGGYTPSTITMSPTDPDGTVVADNGGAVRLNSAKLGAARWMETDEKGLMIGTLNGEWVILPVTTTSAMSATNIMARNSTRRGSAAADAIKSDRQVLFIQRGKRSIYEMAYSYEADGYRSPLMSIYASHMFTKEKTAEQIVFCADPHNLAFIRRSDGTVVSLTYNRDENVMGYYEHDFGGVVEWIESMPAPDAARDDLWMIINRTINGETHRYIERLKPFWDFGNSITDAWYLDCALSFSSTTALTDIYGLEHLEGEKVYALADGVRQGPFVVSGGKITLSVASLVGVVGKGYESLCEIARIDAGATDGTAQGKLKRVPSLVAQLWDSSGGEFGVFNEDKNEIVWEPIPYESSDASEIENVGLYNAEVEVPLDSSFNRRGTVFFRKPEDSPLPFNLIRICPSVLTEDAP